MSYEVLARKYRPINFEEVIGQNNVVKALVNSIKQEKVHQAYIFAGTRGIGKTTIARILAKCLNCESSSNPTPNPCNKCSNTIEITSGRSVDFLEIDAASNTQVEKIRELIETVEYKPAKGRFKIYLIDEVHMLSKASFNALLKTLEEPPPHVVFLFATTNPEMIPKTVQSRCLQLNLKTVNDELLIDHLRKILTSEKIKFDEDSISLIANSANGSVRDGLTLLDQAIAFGNGKLAKEEVGTLLGSIDNSLIFELVESVIDGDGKKTFNTLAKIEELLPEYDVILKNIISILHKISLQQALGDSKDETVRNLALKIDKEFCQLLYEIALNAFSKFSVHPSPKESLEICLLRMLTFNPLQKLSESNNSIESKEIQKKNLKNDIDTYSPSENIEEVSKKLIASNEHWISFFESSKMSPFARNHFGEMSFKSFVNDTLTLTKKSDAPDVPENILLELRTVFKEYYGVEKNLDIKFDVGEVLKSPFKTINERESKKLSSAMKNIKEDKDIQNFLKKFNGTLKEDSIKPIK